MQQRVDIVPLGDAAVPEQVDGQAQDAADHLLRRRARSVEAEQPAFAGNLPRFAIETILWGRKSGTMLARLRAVPREDERAAVSPRTGVLA
jgi:hypothetical protein